MKVCNIVVKSFKIDLYLNNNGITCVDNSIYSLKKSIWLFEIVVTSLLANVNYCMAMF